MIFFQLFTTAFMSIFYGVVITTAVMAILYFLLHSLIVALWSLFLSI